MKFLGKQLEAENIVLSDVTQKTPNTPHVLSHLWFLISRCEHITGIAEEVRKVKRAHGVGRAVLESGIAGWR